MALGLFLAVGLALMAGYPVAFTLAGVALLFAGIGMLTGTFDPVFLEAFPNRVFGIMTNETLIAVPVFGYKSHISIDRRFGFIRESAVTSASAADGRQLRRLVSPENTGSEVWADSAYRSQRNETWLAKRMLTSRIHRRKPAGKPMPRHMARANAKKSAIRAAVEHVFAHQKARFGLFIHWGLYAVNGIPEKFLVRVGKDKVAALRGEDSICRASK